MEQLLNFEEFIQHCGTSESLMLYQEVPFPNFGYQKLLDLFHQYCLVGGFPDVVTQYARQKETSKLNTLYNAHLEKLFSKASAIGHTRVTKERALQIFQDAFAFAGMRIKYRGFSNPQFGSRMVGSVFHELDHQKLLHLIFPTTSANLPLKPEPRRSPRIQLVDTGLVAFYNGIQDALIHSQDLSAVFNRQMSLHIVGQELLMTSNDGILQGSFWVREKTQSSAEVDFVISYQGMLIPVEVRSGEPGTLRSIHQFIDASSHRFAIQLHAGPLTVRETKTIRGKIFYLMTLPYFLAGKIREHLEGFVRFVHT